MVSEIDQVELRSEKRVDYTQLQEFLRKQLWKEADEETARVVLKAASQEEKSYLNSEDLKKLPSTDLYTIDQLWLKSSKGRFGFSVQKEIWLSVGDVSNPSKESNYKILVSA